MKVRITDPEIIREQERSLFEAISKNLDWDALAGVFRQRHRLAGIETISAKNGDFVAEGEGVAYRLDFDVSAVLSVVFDRSGNYLPRASALHGQPDLQDSGSDPQPESASGFHAEPPPAEVSSEDQETIGLEQIVRGRSDMIRETPPLEKTPPKPPPAEKMSHIATELADMISDINGKKKK